MAAALLAISLSIALAPSKSFAATPLNASAPTAKNGADDKEFSALFREGRDLIDNEEWAAATKKFSALVAKFPEHKSAAAALYWLAFCYKKQKMFQETEATLDRLLEKFPASSWASDARVMKMEIAAALGKWNRATVVPGTAPTLPAGVYATTLPNKNAVRGAVTTVDPAAAATLETLTPYNKIAGVAETPLDREDEIKIAAFQSLFSADAKRGIEAVSGILNSDSKASETLKIEVLRALRRPFVSGSLTPTKPAALISNVNSLSSELIPVAREILIKSFKEEKSAKVRREIIYTLANLRDAQSFEYLARLYESETDREIKKAIINGFGSFANANGILIAAFSGNNSSQSPNAVTSKTNTPAKGLEFAKLLEIFKTEKDAELRSLALSNLQRFEGWETDAKIVETLIQIYDSEPNEDSKKSIVQSLGKINQPAALRRLFDIAKTDKSDKLRLEAIYALRNSKNPEALKFLEELLK